jgi:hypothetical protein
MMSSMAEELQSIDDLVEADPVRPLPARSENRAIVIWGREVGPLAVAATAGAAAGVAAVAVARAARSPRRPPRRGLFRRREKVVASRSFLVDVHVLGR